MNGHVKDITGHKYGRLTVREYSHTTPTRGAHWICDCECGGVKIVSAHSLRSNNNTRSCGCLHTEQSSSLCKKRNHRHGMANAEPLYGVWKSMRQRCNNPRQHDYRWYGALGVTVCSEWDEYPTFRAWAIRNGYIAGLTIDRTDPSGPYSPDNCRWATWKQQGENRTVTYEELASRQDRIRGKFVKKGTTFAG